MKFATPFGVGIQLLLSDKWLQVSQTWADAIPENTKPGQNLAPLKGKKKSANSSSTFSSLLERSALFFLFCFSEPSTKLRALCVLGKPSATKLNTQPQICIILIKPNLFSLPFQEDGRLQLLAQVLIWIQSFWQFLCISLGLRSNMENILPSS